MKPKRASDLVQLVTDCNIIFAGDFWNRQKGHAEIPLKGVGVFPVGWFLPPPDGLGESFCGEFGYLDYSSNRTGDLSCWDRRR